MENLKRHPINKISKYMRSLLQNESERYDQLWLNKLKIIENGCIYYPEFFENKHSRNIFNNLKYELKQNKECNIKNWSKHFKFENPNKLPTFQNVINIMSKLFNVEIIETRLNYYPNGESNKPYHHDKHYSGKYREDFTMGASFGSTRSLSFRDATIHDNTRIFNIPQENGDIFAFDADVNKMFQHGIPKNNTSGERFSIIAWGIRKPLDSSNNSLDIFSENLPIPNKSRKQRNKKLR